LLRLFENDSVSRAKRDTRCRKVQRYQSAFFTEMVEAPKDNPVLNDFLAHHSEVPRVLTANQLRQILSRMVG
jgi:hypothetical protein